MYRPTLMVAGNSARKPSANSRTASATSMVEASEVLVTVRLTDGLPLKRPSVSASSSRNSISAISPSCNCPPLSLLLTLICAISSGSGATPIPRNRMSPSLAFREPPGKSRRLLRIASSTCPSDILCAASTNGSTSTHISHSRLPATPTLATPGICAMRCLTRSAWS